MGEVIRALEGPIAPMVCASEDPTHAALCGRSGFCTVNLLWVKVRDAVAGALDELTLADLVTPRALEHPFHRSAQDIIHAATPTDPVQLVARPANLGRSTPAS
jgi:DNA-binding IscR family transcriptional regulator